MDAFGLILNIDKTFLGMTILGFGTAMPDAFLCMALTRKKAENLAISGGVWGNLFGMLAGFGVAQLKESLDKGKRKFDLFNTKHFHENLFDILLLITMALSLMATIVFAMCNGYVMTRKYAITSIVFYVVFILF